MSEPPSRSNDDLRTVLLQVGTMPELLTVNGKRYTLAQPIAAGLKGVVWRVQDEFGRQRALKICTADDYEDRSYLEEVQLVSALERYREFVHFIDAGPTRMAVADEPEQEFMCFVEEWVDGLTLEAFLLEHPKLVTASFLLGYARSFCVALGALRAHGLMHDDLHPRNVMLARPVPAHPSPEWSLKIVDSGSIKSTARPTSKAKDDHRHFAEHLVLIWNTVHRQRLLTVRDRRFLAEVARLLDSMLDDDPSVALRDPAQIATHLERADTRASYVQPKDDARPSSPFEFISAEHIADDRLLVELFARSCPFLEKVDGPDPCLVTGPRGCGKSTIFRWLSLKAHLHKPADDIDSFRIAGFYISCSSDLQNRFGWIRTEALAQRFRREVVHYFNLLLAREVVHTLSMIAARKDSADFWGFGPPQENAVCDFVAKSLQPTARPRVQGVSRLAQAAESIEAEMFATNSQMLRGLNVPSCTSEAFLGDLSSLLAREMEYFRNKRVTFLIDDFSSHRIPLEVQTVLNQVVWERRASHVFKLSSEKYGAQLTDALGATIDITREMVEIDCGREFIALDDADKVSQSKQFATELLDNRLRAAGYKGDAASLIGPSEWSEGSLGRALADRPSGRVHDQYHGLDCIAGVCSGDVSTLLLVYRRIFDRGNVTPASTTRVPKHTQHDAIVSVSRELFEAIKHHVPCGPEMYAVVGAFGVLVRNILQQGRRHKKAMKTAPPQCPRIELDQTEGGVVERLSAEQKQLARELIRRAIFIEMEPGLSRHGNVTTVRWHMRRVFLPAFSAALAKNDAIKRDINWLKFLLSTPKGACELVWKSWPRQLGDDDQAELFDGASQERW